MTKLMRHYIISPEVRKALLNDLYAEDIDLIKKYHAVGGEDATVGQCADKTFETIQSQEGVKFVRVMTYTSCFSNKCVADSTVGYYTEQHLDNKRFVMSFFVRPKFRNKVMLDLFWNHVLQFGPFYTSVSEKNSRAIEHFERNNFEKISEGEFEGLNWIMYYKK